ncbi:MAG: hypothetical protein FJX65_04580 [Alphaproteobacteria bacterium]|nr:hypothetical protein [Alphaproteobacteria bacterium]
MVQRSLVVLVAWAFLVFDGSPVNALAGSRVNSGYSDSLVIDLAQRGIPTVVEGSLSGTTGEGLAERIRSMLRLPAYFASGRFVPGPREAGRGLRLVLIVNPDNPIQAGQRLCGETAGLASGGNPGRFVLIGAFCRDGAILSEVDIRESSVSGIDDPRFRRHLDQAMGLVFPNSLRVSPNL